MQCSWGYTFGVYDKFPLGGAFDINGIVNDMPLIAFMSYSQIG
jgi:hypothetical protein